ncbi:MAG: DNA replication and repair protein RecF, partial [Symbiobacteriaceae bacterium]|nr:DNA replication and repair protein RecF [Symbiobacteriaceae bacterium]
MQLKSLSLHTFRNYNHLELHLHPQMNLFIGKNGQGKTNILEACHLLATARSHRGAKDSELVKWGEREYHLGAQIVTRYGSQTINLHYNPQQGRKGQVNGSWLPRLLDLIGNLKLVFFAPEHLSLVKGDPGQRRRFLDILFSQLSKQYLYNLSQYNRVLREKNTLLKSEPREYQLLEVYNQQL